MPTRVTHYLAALLVGVILVASQVLILNPVRYPFSGNDPAGYANEAANLLAGNGLRRTPASSDPIDEDLVYCPYFPPGFSLAVAGLGALGVPPDLGVRWVPWIAWALLPIAILYALGTLLSPVVAVAVGVLVVTSPGATDAGYGALSDVPFLLTVLCSIGLLMRHGRNPGGLWSLLLAGALAGIAYSIRNAGRALFAATFAGLMLAPVFRLTGWRVAARNLLTWGVGALIVVVPLLLRNLAIFGTVQPYAQGPSGMGAVESVRLYLWSLLLDVTGSKTIAQFLAWDALLFLVMAVPLIAIAIWGLARAFLAANSQNRYSLLTLVVYLAAGSAMVMIGRAKFDWVETSLVRYVLQYTWIVITLIFVGLATLPSDRLARRASAAMFAALFAGHLIDFTGSYEREKTIQSLIAANRGNLAKTAAQTPQNWILTGQIRRWLSRDESLLNAVGRLPADAIIMSNVASFLYLNSGRPVRTMDWDTPQAFEQARRLVREARHPLYLVLLPTNQALRTQGARWQEQYLEALGGNVVVARKDPNWLIIRRVD